MNTLLQLSVGKALATGATSGYGNVRGANSVSMNVRPTHFRFQQK